MLKKTICYLIACDTLSLTEEDDTEGAWKQSSSNSRLNESKVVPVIF